MTDESEHRPAENSGGLCRRQTRSVIQGLASEHHHVHAADLVDRGRQDAGGALGVEVLKALVADEDCVVGAHRQGVLEGFLSGIRPDAQRRDSSAVSFLLQQRSLDRILVEGIDHKGGFPPRDPISAGSDLCLGIGHLFYAGYDLHNSPPREAMADVLDLPRTFGRLLSSFSSLNARVLRDSDGPSR